MTADASSPAPVTPAPGPGQGPAVRRRLPALGPRSAAILSVILALGIVPLAWPVRAWPGAMLDTSWMIGLHMAAQEGLHFGSDLAFTYGPLGFLSRPTPFLGFTSALAFVATTLMYLAGTGVVLAAARRHFPLLMAAGITLVAARGFVKLDPFETLQVAAFVACVAVLARAQDVRPAAASVIAVGLGALAAGLLLGKLNIGVFVAAMGALAVAAINPRRPVALLVYAASFAGTALLAWLVTGQRLSDLAPYVRSSYEIVSGYSDAMGVSPAGTSWQYPAFAIAAGITAWAAWAGSDGWTRFRRIALAGLLALLLFAVWKYAFVRAHPAAAFATLGIATLALLPARLPRITVILALAVFGVGFVASSGVRMSALAGVAGSASQYARQATTALLPPRWDAAVARSRHDLQQRLHVPAAMVDEIAGQTVHVDPYVTAAVWAYPGPVWRPEPVFQSYSAYTPYLDDLNAEVLRAPDRPRWILRSAGAPADGASAARPRAVTIDGRNYWFESPAATLERLCRYREVSTGDGWQLLVDTGMACGPGRSLGTVTARAGEPVTVPAAPGPRDFVLVRILGVGSSPAARLRTTVWKSPTWSIKLDDLRYRLVPGTASQGLVLSVPDVAQGSAQFRFGPPIRTITVSSGSSRDELTFEFITVSHPGP